MSTREKILLFLLIFFLPSNLAYHFDNYPLSIIHFPFLVQGITVDYLIPKLFLTDIFILALVIPWLIKKFKSLFVIRYSLFALFFLWTLFQAIFLAQNQLAAIYMWLKLLEMSFILVYLRSIINYQLS